MALLVVCADSVGPAMPGDGALGREAAGSMQRAGRRPTRVFIGLTEVAGYFGNLETALRSLGVGADFIDESDHAFRYRRPTPLGVMAGLVRRALNRSEESTNWLATAAWWLVALPVRGSKVIARCWLFVVAATHYDAFIFCGGDSLLPRNADLPILRRLGKKVIWVFTGSDHRPPYLDGLAVHRSGADAAALIAESVRVQQRVRLAEEHADWVVALPASSQFHTRPFINFLRIGIPFDADSLVEVGPDPFLGMGTRLLHAPSHAGTKGTRWVRQCVGRLSAKGHAIDYLELSGRVHAEVLAAIAHCDLVVDEVFSDTPMAVLATEAAAFGKPTVLAGYYADLLSAELPAGAIPPTMFVQPTGLCDAVERIVADTTFRRDLGSRARQFVQEQWTAGAVAERFLRLCTGDVPAEWVVYPADVQYTHGSGLSEREVRTAIGRVVTAGGEGALFVDHNPRLRERLLRLAEGNPAAYPGGPS